MFKRAISLGGGNRTAHKITYRQWHTVEDSTTIYRQIWLDGDSSNLLLNDTMPGVTTQGRVFDQTPEVVVDGVTYGIRTYNTNTGSKNIYMELKSGNYTATTLTRATGVSVNISQRYDVSTDFVV